MVTGAHPRLRFALRESEVPLASLNFVKAQSRFALSKLLTGTVLSWAVRSVKGLARCQQLAGIRREIEAAATRFPRSEKVGMEPALHDHAQSNRQADVPGKARQGPCAAKVHSFLLNFTLPGLCSVWYASRHPLPSSPLKVREDSFR